MDNSRYSRQILLDEIGVEGQNRLLQSKVAIVGCGGLGASGAAYLAGAGVGKLVLIDGDMISVSNLHRQITYKTKDTGNKALTLRKRLLELNPQLTITAHPYHLQKSNAAEFLKDCDLILECTDIWDIKMLTNDFCYIYKIPLIYGAIFKYHGYVSLFPNNNGNSIHLRDIFPDDGIDLPSCAEVGVLNTAVGIISLLQANEAIKFLLKIGRNLENQLLAYDALNSTQRIIKLKKAFDKNMNKIWESSTYAPIACNVPEISYKELNKIENLNIISILEIHEHLSISDQTIHLPLSDFHVDRIPQFSNKVNVFYCQIGQRSSKLVEQLTQQYPNVQMYSLKGGLKEVKESQPQ